MKRLNSEPINSIISLNSTPKGCHVTPHVKPKKQSKIIKKIIFIFLKLWIIFHSFKNLILGQQNKASNVAKLSQCL